ncbi:MAG: sodium pump decarboxylase gamma subunit [Clostridia bacterium]|nr:sodium pump decarboxylase gamma subunit [Clostridia bacterium]
MASLDIMWKGMLAIFVVIGAIILVTAILNRVTNRKKKEKKEDQ